LLSSTGDVVDVVWQQITERGIGNGVSLVISIGILARLPAAVQGIRDMFGGAAAEHGFNPFVAVILIALLVAVVAGVIAVTQAQRKVPVQYAQRAVGRKVYQGGTSFMPLRVNYAGVMPVIFAGALLMFPAQIFSKVGQWLTCHSSSSSPACCRACALYLVLYGLRSRSFRIWS
jgi:preprotein translocase subunit SecY